jgi:hypothetical protein
MDIVHVQYIVQYYNTGKDAELHKIREEDFGVWVDIDDPLSDYEEALDSFNDSVSHCGNEPHRIVKRITKINVTELEIEKHTP